MRRAGTSIILLIVALAVVAGTAVYAYGKGKSDGQSTAAADRSAFTARGTTVGGAGGFGGAGGSAATGRGGAGGFGGAGGSAAAGRGGAGGAGTPSAGGAAAASGVTGKVTNVSGATLTIQRTAAAPSAGAGGAAVTITTSNTTTVTTFAAATLADLKSGDIVAMEGDKTGDTAYTAKRIFALSGLPGGANAAGGTGRNAAGGSPVSGAPGGQSGQGGQRTGGGGFGGGGTGFAGLQDATLGRITNIEGATITLQGFDGTTSTVTTNASTSVRKQGTGTVGDIKVGDTIFVQGDSTSDTAYTARAIIDQGG